MYIAQDVMVELLKLLGSIVAGCATVLAALIVAVAGGVISGRYRRKRDLQDRESQWRDHAIELSKLDLESKIKNREERKLQGKPVDKPLRSSILDFLANYRDLTELGTLTPKELYVKIRDERTNPSPEEDGGEG